MKIRNLTPENHTKTYALLRLAFPDSTFEVQLVEQLHANGKAIHDWVCIQANRVIAYIAFTNAYNGSEVCGLHLAPLAVRPEFQKRGVGAELIRFAMRQDIIKEKTIFVLGDPGYYQKFGFAQCEIPLCPFAEKRAHFLSIRNTLSSPFTVGYEPEFGLEEKL